MRSSTRVIVVVFLCAGWGAWSGPSAAGAGAAPVHDHGTHAAPRAASAGSEGGFFTHLFKSYTPRKVCMNEERPLIGLHLASDSVIALAYFTIPLALLRFVRRRHDLAFNWMFVCFAVFILACGLTHVMNILAIWNPVYRADGLVKAVTALASIGTAVALWQLIPAALALPSPAQLAQANGRLEQEVGERRRAEEELRAAQQELERRVQERTAALAAANESLRIEVAARAAAQEAARASEDRLAGVIGSAMDAILSVDEEQKLVMFNAAAEAMFRCDARDAIGKPLDLFVPGRFRAGHRQHVEAFGRTGVTSRAMGAHSRTLAALRCDGEEFPVEATISRVTVRGKPLYTAIVRDVTERVRAEAERERAEAEREQLLASERAARSEAERVSRMKDEFVATVSHELRTPLNAILGWAQLLRRNGSSYDGDVAQGLETIERNARVQSQLVEDLLDVSRMMSGKIRLDVQPVDLVAVITAAVETVRPAAEAKGIRVSCVLDPKAQPVAGDPGRLQQVVWNLLSNAVKFTPKGGRVQVLSQRVNSHVEISVIDNGEGISPDFLPHVFERFRQQDASASRRHGGLGLGLSLVRQLVEMHGGSVHAHSAGVGQGATVTVHLPIGAVQPRDGAAVHPAAPPDPAFAAERVDLAGVEVLAVDDDPDARLLVKRVLEECGARVRLASSAAEGIELLVRQRPHVLVSDIGMPGEDGYAFIRRVRALGPAGGGNVPAAALTAFARSEDRRRALVAGYQSHVVKPVDASELATVVASLAGRTGAPPDAPNDAPTDGPSRRPPP